MHVYLLSKEMRKPLLKKITIYIIKQDIHIDVALIGGQTAGPIGLIFLWTLMGVIG